MVQVDLHNLLGAGACYGCAFDLSMWESDKDHIRVEIHEQGGVVEPHVFVVEKSDLVRALLALVGVIHEQDSGRSTVVLRPE